jgi:hypothetical protein
MGVLGALLAVLVAPLVVALALSQIRLGGRYDSRWAVVANAEGLHSSSGAGGGMTPVMPWDAMRAWALVTFAPHAWRSTWYAVVSANETLIWQEPTAANLAGGDSQGDRGQGYRERATQLHALIAARTGLPLKVIQVGEQPAQDSEARETQSDTQGVSAPEHGTEGG